MAGSTYTVEVTGIETDVEGFLRELPELAEVQSVDQRQRVNRATSLFEEESFGHGDLVSVLVDIVTNVGVDVAAALILRRLDSFKRRRGGRLEIREADGEKATSQSAEDGKDVPSPSKEEDAD